MGICVEGKVGLVKNSKPGSGSKYLSVALDL